LAEAGGGMNQAPYEDSFGWAPPSFR